METLNRIWAIARVDRDKINTISSTLSSLGYDVMVKIPSVKILKKKFKNQLFFEDVPLLFDYGFFGITPEMARSREVMQGIKEDVPPILSWLFLTPKEVLSKRLRLKKKFTELYPDIDEEGISDRFASFYLKNIVKVKSITEIEVDRLMEIGKCFSVFSASDIENVPVGSIITLRGYPFDNLEAELISLNHGSKTATVSLCDCEYSKEVTVSFDNLFYTVYANLDESISKLSIEDIYEKGENDDED